jgi:plasmid maintenance system antidote protein VapI
MSALPQLADVIVITVEDISDTLAGIAEQISVDVALDVARHFGGTRLYVHSRWREGLPIAVLGEETAQRLCRMFGGELIDVPKCPWLPAAIIRISGELRARGLPVNDIARLLDLSWRTVNKALSGQMHPASRKGRPADDRQMDIENWIGRNAAE